MARNTTFRWTLSFCLIAILASNASATAHHKANHSGGPQPSKEEPVLTEEEPTLTEEQPAPSQVLFADLFDGPDTLITNHYAMWQGDPNAYYSDDWEVESGSFFRHNNAGSTGIPTDNIPNIDSSNGSGSQIFRLWTKRSDFHDVRVDFALRNEGYTASATYPERSWDGIKIWLRRQGGSGSVALYTAEVNRRHGNVVIQKKCAGVSTYEILAQSPSGAHPAKQGSWENVGGAVRNNPDGTVTLTVLRNNTNVLQATDTGVGCSPITTSGKIGVRGDNTQFSIDNLAVTGIGQ